MKQQFESSIWLIFDFGGVIAEPNQKQLINDWSNKIGIPSKSIEVFLSNYREELQLGKLPIDVFWKNFAKEFYLDDPILLSQLWLEHYASSCTLNLPLLEYIQDLRKNYKICLLSNTSKLYLNSVLEKKLDLYFDKKYTLILLVLKSQMKKSIIMC